jgi:hypothetical protein
MNRPSVDNPPNHDLSTVRRALAEVDLRNATHDEIMAIVQPLFVGLLATAISLEPPQMFYRARATSHQPSTLSELWYPPAANARTNRANHAGQPILYCAVGAIEPVFFELRNLTVGSHVTVLWVRLTRNLILQNIGYQPEHLKKLGSQRTVRPPHAPLIEDRRSAEIHHLLGDLFTEVVPAGEEWRYKTTIAIAERLLGENETPIGGLMYPTIAMRANADNVAIRRSFADTGLEFVRAEYRRVTAISGPLALETDTEDVANSVQDGALVWQGGRDEWTVAGRTGLVMTAEDNRWVARDQHGNIVPPNPPKVS